MALSSGAPKQKNLLLVTQAHEQNTWGGQVVQLKKIPNNLSKKGQGVIASRISQIQRQHSPKAPSASNSGF
jgi:hypothetical protein